MANGRRRCAGRASLFAVALVLATSCSDGDGDSGGGGFAAGVPECLDDAAVYALVGPESDGFDEWSDARDLAGELGSSYAGDLPDAPLDITGPSEESGTYDSFVASAIQEIAEERAQEPQTRLDYVSSPNDNVIIQGIEESDTAFGWVGYGFYHENQDRVNAIEIADENGNCVTPSDETIASGEYPYSRPLYIYVNKAKAEEKGAVGAFVDFYLGQVGYDAVKKAGYVQLTDDAWAETRDAWSAAGISGEVSDGESIVVSGSSTVEPITSLVAEKFLETNDVGFEVDGPGTGDGFELFCSGETDISDASRAIKEEEKAACEDAGIEYVELQIGIDGLSVLTSK